MNDNTLLHRQVHPSWVQQGRVTSQLFKPTPKDERKLSVYDGDQISAENAWIHFSGTLGHPSVGVLSVTVSECGAQGLRVAPDPEPFPEHVVIDYTGLSAGQIEKAAKRLNAQARQRNWQFQAAGA